MVGLFRNILYSLRGNLRQPEKRNYPTITTMATLPLRAAEHWPDLQRKGC